MTFCRAGRSSNGTQGLSATMEVSLPEPGAADWTLRFQNTGSRASFPISDIQSLRASLKAAAVGSVLHTHAGLLHGFEAEPPKSLNLTTPPVVLQSAGGTSSMSWLPWAQLEWPAACAGLSITVWVERNRLRYSACSIIKFIANTSHQRLAGTIAVWLQQILLGTRNHTMVLPAPAEGAP